MGNWVFKLYSNSNEGRCELLQFYFFPRYNLNVVINRFDTRRGAKVGDLGRSSVDLWKHVRKVNLKQWAYQGAYSTVQYCKQVSECETPTVHSVRNRGAFQ